MIWFIHRLKIKEIVLESCYLMRKRCATKKWKLFQLYMRFLRENDSDHVIGKDLARSAKSVTTLARPEKATVANCGSPTAVINFDLNFLDLGYFLPLLLPPCLIASLICFLPHSILFILTGWSVVSTIVTPSTRFSVFNREINEIWDPPALKRYCE